MQYGGVSPQKYGPVLEGATGIAPAAPPAAGKYTGFVYHGGPIITAPSVTVTFWGPSWTSGGAASRLDQFCQDLLVSGFMNVISQYGVGSGTYAGSSNIASVASQLNDAGVQSTIQSAIDAGTVPEPPANNTSQVLIVFLDESIEINDPNAGLVLCEPTGDTAFGYHNFFTTRAGNDFYYSIVPALDDACLQASCPGGDSGCSLSLTETQEQRRTQVASHEFAEMTTDPHLSGWYDQQNGENGDICNGEADTITVGANTWTVQRIYSKTDDMNSNGATFCISSAPSPIPPLPLG